MTGTSGKRAAAAGVVAAIAMYGCTFGSPSTAGASTSGKTPVKIGVVLSETGATSALGKYWEQGVKLAQKEFAKKHGYEGHPVQLSVVDDQSQTTQAVADVKNFIQQGVDAIVGPGIAGGCYAAAPIVDEAHSLAYCLSGAPVAPNDTNMLFALPPLTSEFNVLVPWFHKHNYKSVGLITSTDQSGNVIATAVKGAFTPSTGITVTGIQYYNDTDNNMTTQLTQLKAQNPSVLYVATTGLPAAATILQDLAGLNWKVPVVLSPNEAVPQAVSTLGSILPKTGLFNTGLPIKSGNSSIGAFYSLYAKTYPGQMPNQFSASAYDAVNVEVQAVVKGGKGQAALSWLFKHKTPIQGAEGPLHFGPKTHLRGLGGNETTVLQITKRGFKVVR